MASKAKTVLIITGYSIPIAVVIMFIVNVIIIRTTLLNVTIHLIHSFRMIVEIAKTLSVVQGYETNSIAFSTNSIAKNRMSNF